MGVKRAASEICHTCSCSCQTDHTCVKQVPCVMDRSCLSHAMWVSLVTRVWNMSSECQAGHTCVAQVTGVSNMSRISQRGHVCEMCRVGNSPHVSHVSRACSRHQGCVTRLRRVSAFTCLTRVPCRLCPLESLLLHAKLRPGRQRLLLLARLLLLRQTRHTPRPPAAL